MKRLMKKMNEDKGFTLAELLIVVAIIAVLVAVAIPVFTTQLNNAKLATATANARSAYAEYIADCLSNGDTATLSGASAAIQGADLGEASVSVSAGTVTVTLDGASNSPATFSISTDLE